MESYYFELVRFDFDHEYYTSMENVFAFYPQQDTQRLLRRLGLLFRSTATGFIILYEAVTDEIDALVPIRKLPQNFALRFWVCPTSPIMGAVSALPLVRANSQILYFDNLTDRSDGDTLYLNSAAPASPVSDENDMVALAPATWKYGEAATESVFVSIQSVDGTVIGSEYCRPRGGNVQCQIDLSEIEPGLLSITAGSAVPEIIYRQESLPPKSPFAAVDLLVSPSIPQAYSFVGADGLPQSKTFTCRIGKRSSLWRYIVVPKFNTSLRATQLSITDGDTRYTFGDAVEVQTMSGEPAFAIISNDVIPLQETPVKGLSLKRNQADLIKELPNPGPDQLKGRRGSFYSEIYVYV